jgi:hypothetical protein
MRARYHRSSHGGQNANKKTKINRDEHGVRHLVRSLHWIPSIICAVQASAVRPPTTEEEGWDRIDSVEDLDGAARALGSVSTR